MQKELICTVCPMGCCITIIGEGEQITSVTGNTCPRGEAYARSEFVCPTRTLTTTDRVSGAAEPTVAVRSAAPIPKARLMDAMAVIREAVFPAPITAHQVLIPDLCGTGVALIASTGRKAI